MTFSATSVLISFVAALHVYFLILEMFLWDKPAGLRAFGHNESFAKASKTLAMNQGLYNGFLSAGLIWGLTLGHPGESILLFFLGCIIVAGVFGGITANQKILYIQALPALIAVSMLLFI